MVKRKPGRPRKVAESFEFPEAIKRKPGRPRKIASAPLAERTAPPEPAQSLYRYTVKTIQHDGYTDSETIEANDFVISGNGDLLLFVGTEVVAAFRQWIGITGEKVSEPAKKAPEVTLSAAPPLDNTNQAQGKTYDYTSAPLIDPSDRRVVGYANVEVSPNNAQTVTFSNGIQLVESDRPE